MNTIGFIGAGNMGSAILRGIAGSDMKPEAELFAYNPTEAKVDALADCGVQKCKSAAEVVEKSRYVFLAIKPQKFEEVLPQIADAVTEQTVLVSIAAGIGAEFIRKLTKPFAKVVLAMPNTPLLLGEGATALAKDDSVSDAEFAVVRNIFGSCGMTAVIAPEQMKALLDRIRQTYDYCLIDAPAGLGMGFHLASDYADRAVVVTNTDASSLRDAQRTVMELDRLGRGNLHLVVGRVEKKLLRSLHTTIDDAMDAAGLPLLGVVPEDRNVPYALNTGIPLRECSNYAARAYENIARRIMGQRIPLMRI